MTFFTLFDLVDNMNRQTYQKIIQAPIFPSRSSTCAEARHMRYAEGAHCNGTTKTFHLSRLGDEHT
jgi:hypothetical protein